MKSRIGRVLGAAFVAGAILAGPMGLSQASAASLTSFSAEGTGYALRISVDLSGLKQVPGVEGALNTLWSAAGQSGSFPFVIDQYLVKSTTDGDNKLTNALSVLGEGFTNFGGANARATTVGQSRSVTVAAQKLPTATLPLVDLAVGVLNAAVHGGPVVNGDGSLAHVSASLKDILAAVGAQGVDLTNLTASLDNLLNQVNGSSGLLSQLQDTIASGLASSAVSGVAPVTDTLTSLPGIGSTIGGILGDGSLSNNQQVTDITNTLTSALNLTALPNIFDTDLASINSLVNKASAMKQSGAATATSTSSLKSISVLGGFIQAGLVNLSSMSTAAGVPGSAKNTSSCSIANVKIGGSNGVSLDGKTVYINGSPVAIVGSLVGTVKGLVDGLLATLGTSVKLCDVAQKSADADGSAAAQRVSALRVDIAPTLPGLGQLVKVIVDPTVETSVAAAIVAPTVTTSHPNLPKTGAGILATVIVGSALAFGALVIRRRFA